MVALEILGCRVSVHDVIAEVTGKSADYASHVYSRLLREGRIPSCDVCRLPPRLSRPNSTCHRNGRGGGRGERDTPVATVAEMVEIIWQLPGSAEFRRNCAKLTVRYLGGDERAFITPCIKIAPQNSGTWKTIEIPKS